MERKSPSCVNSTMKNIFVKADKNFPTRCATCSYKVKKKLHENEPLNTLFDRIKPLGVANERDNRIVMHQATRIYQRCMPDATTFFRVIGDFASDLCVARARRSHTCRLPGTHRGPINISRESVKGRAKGARRQRTGGRRQKTERGGRRVQQIRPDECARCARTL